MCNICTANTHAHSCTHTHRDITELCFEATGLTTPHAHLGRLPEEEGGEDVVQECMPGCGSPQAAALLHVVQAGLRTRGMYARTHNVQAGMHARLWGPTGCRSAACSREDNTPSNHPLNTDPLLCYRYKCRHLDSDGRPAHKRGRHASTCMSRQGAGTHAQDADTREQAPPHTRTQTHMKLNPRC